MTEQRVRIVHDTDPSEPYDDGGSPIIMLEYADYRGWHAEQVADITSYKLAGEIVDAARRCGSDRELFERYLRAFHGVTQVEQYGDRGGATYLSFDPADWREAMGLPADKGELYAYGVAHNLDRTFPVNMSEYVAYLEGDAWGWVLERLETWTNTRGETRETWEHVDSCWGYYGREYVEEAARQACGEDIEIVEA